MKENNEIKSTAHSKYRCQYHIVLTLSTNINKFPKEKILPYYDGLTP